MNRKEKYDSLHSPKTSSFYKSIKAANPFPHLEEVRPTASGLLGPEVEHPSGCYTDEVNI